MTRPSARAAQHINSVLLGDVGIEPVPIPFVLSVPLDPLSEVLLVTEDHKVGEVFILIEDELAELAAARLVSVVHDM